MSACKYIAAGFTDDVQKLFDEFIKSCNKEFKTFCELWKKHNFAYIFMGRPHYKELAEFIGEINQLTLNYMTSSSSLNSQIAAIYLLYCLHRSQSIISPVNIRITKLQYSVIQQVHAYAVKDKVRTLHFIIDYLKKNCFELVAYSILHGPNCTLYKENSTKSKANEFVMLSDLKQNVSVFEENKIISSLLETSKQYLEQRNKILPASSALMDNDFDVIRNYEQKIKDLKTVLGKKNISNCNRKDNSDKVVESNKKPTLENDDIGYRRFKLKAAALKIKASSSKIKPHEEETDNEVKFSLTKKRHYNRRLPVNKRRIGRPKKYAEKLVEIDESEDSDFQYSFQIVHKEANGSERVSNRRKVSYLKSYEGPVITAAQNKPIENLSDVSDEPLDD